MKQEDSLWAKQGGMFVLLLLFGVAVLAVALWNATGVTAVNAELPPTEITDTSSTSYGNCRYGVASFRDVDNPFLSQLGVGWAVDFAGNLNRVIPSTVEYVPMVRINQAKNSQGQRLDNYTLRDFTLSDSPGGLGHAVTNNPGRLWFIGNEVDRVYWQDDIMPATYAKAYHDLYYYIKQRDPSAEVAISGLVQVTPGRLQYLDIVWDSYLDRYGSPMPVDVWNMHVYILPERKDNGQGSNAAIALGTDPAIAKWESTNTSSGAHYSCSRDDVYCFAEHDDMTIFAEQVVAMRQWMKDHGQQQKPLILSEWSLLYPFADYDSPTNPTQCYLMDENGNCFTQARVSTFMINSLNYLRTAADANLGYAADGNRLVQQWLWFAMHDGSEATPNALINHPQNPTAFTSIGQTYRSQISSESLYANLKALNTYGLPIGSSSDAQLTVRILNNGNRLVENYTVTFYQDSQLTSAIGSVNANNVMAGCAREIQAHQIVWPNLPDGVHRYWAKITSVHDVNPSDDVIEGFVIIGGESVFLPITLR